MQIPDHVLRVDCQRAQRNAATHGVKFIEVIHELRESFRRAVTEHALADVAHKLLLNRRTDGKVRIGGGERDDVGGLLRPAHVKRAFTQEVEPDDVV